MATGNCTIVGRLKSDGTFDTKNAAYVGLGNKNTAELYPYWLKFTVPTFSGKSSSITFNLSMLQGYRNGSKSAKVNLRWALCTSSANQASYNTVAACAGVSDPNQIKSGTISYDGLTNYYQTKTLTISTTALKSGVSYFLVLWGDSSGGYIGDTATMNASTGHSAVLTYVNTYKLTISQGTGSTITVKKGSTTLTNGATVTYGDKLTISFGVTTGYNLGTHTVNGSTFTSGGTHTVTGAVSVVSTASVKSFTLTISAGTGVSITVKRTSSPKKGATTGTLSSGATIYYSDELSVTYTYSTGYQKASQSHNDGTYTVTSNVTFSATASVKSFTLSISAGEGSGIIINRTSSPLKGASTGALSNGDAIYYSDVLIVTFSASEGYNLNAHTVNGSTFASGGSHTVTAAVSVISTATKKTFKLTISAGAGATVLVECNNVKLSNGATIAYGDVLIVNVSVSSSYKVETCTLNDIAFPLSTTHNVVKDVVICVTTKGSGGTVSIKNGSAFETYQIGIKGPNGFETYELCIKVNGSFKPYS